MGGKGGGGGHTPREAPDNLKSRQILTVIDAISEGPIEGPVSGMQSVRVNNTPVLDAGGNTNIHGVTVTYRVGEQEQTVMPGFEDSGSETLLNVEVKKSDSVTRTITASTIDRLRFTFGVQSLVRTTDKADREPSSVQLQILINRGGTWVMEKDITISGKTTTQYLTSVVVSNLPPRPFDIRMVRITADSTSDQLQNKTVWSGYTEIIDVKQRYPNTAVVGLQVDAEQFGSQQVARNYHMRGRIVRVPSNYDPVKRTYAGIWDGTFKPAYTNNPAFCLLDMLTHPRYGMGGRLGLADVDKWSLYIIAQYCDQLVPDGFGGTEPRMTCNAYLTEQRRAWDVLSDFCSLMRCMPVWNGSTMTFVQDRPADKVWTYTLSNVVMPEDGSPFRYAYSALKDRHNSVEVRYVDPKNGWDTSTELVENSAAIRRYGRNVLKMDAFGCTSRGQAHRTGLWAITTELLETQTVDFSVGAEGLRHTPGDIIEICDSDYAGVSVGGRIISVNSATKTLTLDREITVPASGSTLNIIGGDGKPSTIPVVSVTGGIHVRVATLPTGVAVGSVWGLKLPYLRQRLFRCVAIREGDGGTYSITGIQHVPEKESIVDNGARFDPLPGTVNGAIPPSVEHLTTEILPDGDRYQVEAGWSTPRVVKEVNFSLRLTALAEDDSERLVSSTTVTDTHYRFRNLTPGRYTLTVRTVNSVGQQGDPASASFNIAAPAAPSYIELTPGFFQITARPRQTVYDPTVQYEFWYSDKKITDIRQVETAARYLGTSLYWIISGDEIKPGMDHFIYVRSVNRVGSSIFVEAIGRASNDAAGYLELFKGQIGQTHLAQSLFSKIDNSQLEPELADIRQSVSDTKNEIELVVNKELDGQAATIQQIQKVQKDTNGKLESMWSVKLQQMSNGQYVIAGLGVGIENTPTGLQSQILMMADRIAMVNPANGNTQPLFVAQGNNLYMNDVWLKNLYAVSVTSSGNPPAFSLTPDGRLTAKNADINGTVNATSGHFSNVVIDDTCDIKHLRAEVIEGDLAKNYILNNGATITIPAERFNRTAAIPTIIAKRNSSWHSTGGAGSTDRLDTYSSWAVIYANGVKKYVAGGGNSSGVAGIYESTGSFIQNIPANTTMTLSLSEEEVGGTLGKAGISPFVIVMVSKD